MMLARLLPVWVSATKMSPLSATTMPLGSTNRSLLLTAVTVLAWVSNLNTPGKPSAGSLPVK